MFTHAWFDRSAQATPAKLPATTSFKAVTGRQSLDLWLKGIYPADVAIPDEDKAPRAEPEAQQGGRCKRDRPHTRTIPQFKLRLLRGGWVDFWGYWCIYPAAPALTPFVDLAQSRAEQLSVSNLGWRGSDWRRSGSKVWKHCIRAMNWGTRVTHLAGWAFKQDMVAWVGERPRPG